MGGRRAGGRAVGRSVYGHVITKFSGMGRFTKLWGYARAWELRYKVSIFIIEYLVAHQFPISFN